ncbi:predicted protein [Histoplasma capsulatum G186AR]|uniref:Uncharacterized protein n=1 Tax=Ajellomyces capsulatus (strain G186AR / H82 / ATCC MYA-2454 / RMSCC 2432) TaxID=447093 RepID=C0NGN4_AJECG|nr:uncharacterized protein HCBG_02506 [Histoplasma capsulatum G186AR]EEH08969.1 predicted protein [Histoplasma capsulatum G186AR]
MRGEAVTPSRKVYKPYFLYGNGCQGLPEGTTHPRQWIYISFGRVEMIIIDKEEGREGDEKAGNVGGWSSAGSGHEAAIGALLESVVSNWSQATKLNTAVQGWLRGLFGGENSRTSKVHSHTSSFLSTVLTLGGSAKRSLDLRPLAVVRILFLCWGKSAQHCTVHIR